jgi:hypothetical protein
MLNTSLMQEVLRSGFSRPEGIIHIFVGGSELHGAKVGATDDLDIYGVFLDPPPRGSKGRRPEYEGVFGYDTKAAMHCLRLYLECIELMRFGTITLPRPECQYLIEARSGEWTLDKFLGEAERLNREAEVAAQASPLPEKVDLHAISGLIANVYLAAWV